VAALAQAWLERSEAGVARMRRLAEEGDLATLGGEAHTMKGTAGTMGALRLGRHAARLEEACRRGDPGEARRTALLMERDAPPAFAALRAESPPPERAGAPDAPSHGASLCQGCDHRLITQSPT
jgi:HPt (histidine-containing phosphotransfer) domain-containing protein